ncbi:MAG: hypothetical protein H8E86_02570 [Planctomycetes bacterium]|nr:hypothetical protein [Planctomycetota bacterium]
MASQNKKPIMRCLGEFVGHIIQAVKSDSATSEVKRTVEVKKEGNVTLRRTTIDEIEIREEDGAID